jgi:hypothetical protein
MILQYTSCSEEHIRAYLILLVLTLVFGYDQK